MKLYRFFGILLAILFTTLMQVAGQISFPLNSTYRYIKGSEASTLNSDWMNINFDDSLWSTGNAPFRYADGTGGTELTDMQNNYSTIYLRDTFNASSIDKIKVITFTVNYDDGFIVWINGKEVFRRSAPESNSFNSFATENHESGTAVTIKADSGMFDLIEGTNILAIQGFNVTLESSDFFFDIQMNASLSIPEVKCDTSVVFSHKAGFCSSPFTLTLTSPDNTLGIVYTLDGSNPQTSTTAFRAGKDTTITIDPSSTTGRAATPAFVVRASLSKSGYTPSKPVAHTFIFIESVKTQANPGGSWPTTNTNQQVIDLAMDSRVVTDSKYSNLIDDAFLQIPSISISTDMENLFDPSVGIYVNAGGHGLDWEKFSSVELINPDGSNGFMVNAGLRIRGGWSRHSEYPKHAFRLFFREDYGAAKLNFPLFENEGVSEFDKIDLRCEQNYAWSNWGGEHNTMVREVFSRDSQRDMDQPYTRSRYYHLYLNGMYWGIYQTQERSEAKFAADYLGGNDEDYDVLKVSTDNWSYQVEATDGNLTNWQKVYTMCNTGFTSNENYYKLEGKDYRGRPLPGSEVLVNIDNLIDYMLTIFYTGNFDAPTSAFGGNEGANNFYAIKDRTNKAQGFVFFNHDAEHSMMVDAVNPGIGLYENRVTLSNMKVNSIYVFHPQWLHYKLTSNAEYRMRFADRVAMHMTGTGALTPNECLQRFNNRVSQIDMAIIAESARWGDFSTSPPYTKDNQWLPEIETVRNEFFPYRTQIVLNQLISADLYSTLKSPIIKNGVSVLTERNYALNNQIIATIQNPNTSGEIYYTTNGSDPRLLGGEISSDAIMGTGSISLGLSSSSVIKARILSSGIWSPITEIDFYSNTDDFSTLKITELSYHPKDVINGTDTISGKSYEFIEFKNTGTTALNLSGLTIDSAVSYVFPENTILAPGKFYVIATKPTYFFETYGMLPSGNCEGFFDNGGDTIIVFDTRNTPIITFIYSDELPWPQTPDGDGTTLTSMERNPTGDPSDYTYWTSSTTHGGSPFSDDYQYNFTEPVTGKSDKRAFSVYPNPTTQYLIVEANSDNMGNSATFKIYNLNGSVIYENLIDTEAMINLETIGLSQGVYILKIENETYTQTEKLIYQPQQ